MIAVGCLLVLEKITYMANRFAFCANFFLGFRKKESSFGVVGVPGALWSRNQGSVSNQAKD
jgi:hypothetical protein